jgi:maleylacetoacetate isomerase
VKLYTYFRSSAAYRVRIALNLKGLPYEMVSIHLTKDGGQQRTPEFVAVNPQKRVPALELSSGEVLTQSLAIIEYLDDIHPEPPLLPADALERAKVRAIAQMVACDIHPLNNLIALQYLKRQLKHEQPEIDAWYHHWVIDGFTAIEAMIEPGPYACGAHVTLADICLQCAAAESSARQFSENRRGRCRLHETSGVRQGAAGKSARHRVTRARRPARPRRALPPSLSDPRNSL